ncbi:MAG: diguanylate cyclase [Dokdonella sp.]|nr:diguanylate cyclase [Dokdonella sp.]
MKGPDIASARRVPLDAAGAWLEAQARLDWRSAGLVAFEEWDQAIRTVSRLIAISSAPMALMIGPDGVLLANEHAQQLFAEQTGGSVNARSVLQVLPDSAPFYEAVLAKVRAGESLSFEQQAIRLLSGGAPQTHWFNLHFMPVADAGGSVTAVLGVASDITSLVRQVGQLSDSEQRLRLALEGSGMVGIWTLDLATRTSTADASVARMYGLSVEACRIGVADERFAEAIHPEDRQRVRDDLARAIETGSSYRCKYRILNGDGRTHWVITSARSSCDETGETVRFLGVVVEVTDQMETASALAESRFQFQTLTEALPQIVWSCDADGTHDYFSSRWTEFTGVAPQHITADTWKHLIYPEHRSMVASVWANALRTGAPYDLDYRFRHRSGVYRWLRVMALPIRDADGRITRWFGTSTDVHDAYLLAEERERLARKLERIATEDALTGLLTRRAFLERAGALMRADGRTSALPASLLMMDVDRFKSINDGHGHFVGDRVLAEAAQRITAVLRDRDLVGRLGGEEFAAFLPHCTPDQALHLAERIRRSVELNPIAVDGGRAIEVTISIGAITVSDAGASLDRLLVAADQALYQAKSAGRNRTVFAPAA